MARYLNRIATRMWMLAGLMTTITLVVGISFYYIVAYLDFKNAKERMAPKARHEIERLIAAGQQNTDRYFDLYNKYSDPTFTPTDWTFIALIVLVSTGFGGSVAFFLARRMSRPITAVAKAAAQVSEGNRSVRVVDPAATGEIAELVESFNRMATDIEAYERERTVLTAGIAHELRTPLTILQGRLHGIVDGVIVHDEDEAKRLLRHVLHLSRLVEDLRTLAHADAGELALDLRAVDLAQIARIAIADLRLTSDGVSFDSDLASVTISADAGRLTQIITNLLTNAIKHTPPGGVVFVSTCREKNCAVVRVCDQGPGFREEDRLRLFLPFWRAGQNKSTGHSGSGMGLALAAKLAEAHGGRIMATNQKTHAGATFSLILPLTTGASI